MKTKNVYYGLTALNTFAASLIWGVNTLFLLDAGLSNAEAFAANAAFTLGQVLFEVPTGVVADTVGRRASYLAGLVTLVVTTAAYLWLWKIHGAFWLWVVVSIFLGLGFTFFSGATEAWVVDALADDGFDGSIDDVFGTGQAAAGAAMLLGAPLGGYLAGIGNLGTPYWLRCIVLGITVLATWRWMHDRGFTPRKRDSITNETRRILKASFQNGLQKPAARWMILTGPFLFGVSFYAFYAAQPYLLELYGDKTAFGVAGLLAAIVAGAQIAGGFSTPIVRKVFATRTTATIAIILASVALLTAAGLTRDFYVVLSLLALWALLGSALTPIRRAYLNRLVPSSERATFLSFDGMLGSLGGVFLQPGLGRSADAWGYAVSFVIAGVLQIFALPFAWLAHRHSSKE